MQFCASETELVDLERQLAAAAPSERAARLCALAWALRQRDSGRALSLADQAHGLLTDASDPAATRLRVRLALAAAEMAALQARLKVAEERLTDAWRGLASDPDALTQGDALLIEASVAKALGQRERELGAYARAVTVYADARLRERQALAEAWLAYEGSFGAPDQALGQALPGDAACDALWSAAKALRLSRIEPSEAAALFLHASEQAQRMGLLRLALICMMNAGTALQGLGEMDDALACFKLAEQVAQRSGWPVVLGACQTRLAAQFNELGRLNEAHAMASESLRSLASTPTGINRANASAELARSLMLLGRASESVVPMADAIRMYRESRSTDNLALCLIHQARALAAADQVEPALAAIAEAEALITTHGFTALTIGVVEALAEIHRRHRLPPPAGLQAASAALHYSLATLEEGRRIPGWKAPATLYQALAEDCAAVQDWPQAYQHAQQALALLQSQLAATRQPASERSVGVDASGLWRPAFAAPLQPAEALHLQVTPRERHLLGLLARGFSNKEMAAALAIGDETVKWHLKKIYAKLQVGARKHAVTRAQALGLLEPS